MAEEIPHIKYRQANIADIPSVAKVHVQSWRESFKGIVPQSYLDKMSEEKRKLAFEKAFTIKGYKMFVAEDPKHGIVGFADCGESRYNKLVEGELYAIYLLKDFQRKGIGKLLFSLVIRGLVANGKNSISLVCLEKSPYKYFYEKLNGKLHQKDVTLIEGLEFVTLTYIWKDVALS